MIDFHSHILPAMDDGSRNIEESLQMLRMLQEQGVERVIATPHFYADENPPDVFLRRRADAWEHLRAHLTQGLPHVLLGAEVHYFQGISRTAQVRQLCIQDTGVLLLEMPFSGWSSRTVEDLAALAQQQEMTVVLAHVERYLPDQPRALWPKLRRMGILFQCNASFFLDWRTKHRAVKMLRNREIDILGSDCHGVSYRPPRLDEAAKFICRHAGNEALSRLEDCFRKLIGTDR